MLISSDTAQPSAAAPLEYAKRPRFRRRKWLRISTAIIIAAVVITGWRWGRGWRDKFVLLYHQRACLRYTASPDQVVFDSDPARVAALANDPNYAIVQGCAFRKPPADWNLFTVPQPAQLRVHPAGSGSPGRQAMLFLHECRSPDGTRFLVELERTSGAEESAYFIQGYDVEPSVHRLATLNKEPVNLVQGFDIDVMDGGPHANIRIYAGQPDPADPSHFTIRYEARGKAGMVDGRVDNQGNLTLTRRDP